MSFRRRDGEPGGEVDRTTGGTDGERRSGARLPEALERVTGGTIFTGDVVCPGALEAAFTLSSHEHARVRGVDLGPARETPGVVAAVAGEELGDLRLGRRVRDYPVLAAERVLFVGQRVAAVAAVDRETAVKAADLVKVDYEPLPAVRDPWSALREDAPVLHEAYETYEGAIPERPHPNVQGTWVLTSGDAEGELPECDDVYESTFLAPRSHSAPLEPHTCLVAAGPERVHVFSAHKEPRGLRRDLALVSGRPESDFTIHLAKIGGDFGSKGFPFVEAACYFLSMASGRPVRHAMSYYEELTSTGARHPAVIRLRTGLRSDRLHAHESDVLLDGGAFSGLKPAPMVVVPAIRAPVELYDVPHVHERCWSVYTNSLPGSHVRSPGEFQATFAGESHVDVIARSRGRDPIEFRAANTSDPAVHRVLDEVRARTDQWRAERAGDTDGAGIGVAVCFRDAGPGSTTVACRAERGGVLEVVVPVPDQGAGSYAVVRRLAARTLRVPEEAISVRAADSDAELTDSGAGASRVTAVVGRAAVEACRALIDALGGDPGTEPERGTWIDARLEDAGEEALEARGSWTLDWASPPDFGIRSYAGTAVDVDVDRETGELTIRRALIVADTGVVVNPVAHRGQLEGGFAYGLSQATLEELLVEDGQVVTVSLGDYRLVSAADVPPLEIVLVEPEGDVDELSGIRSVGELTNVGVAPAIANAIDDAVGVRIRELPITPERVLRGLSRHHTQLDY